EHGLIVMACGTHGNVLRFLIPLTLTTEQLDEGLAVVEAGLENLG
ncbi:MAG: 4-aminobutyrate--2-oxoglutarate transaminase, partial [Planctomycetia bacterium]|nr:4-aminobutyrate--2-oxoglutarate transaminase [Planctomycetia bacterium]